MPRTISRNPRLDTLHHFWPTIYRPLRTYFCTSSIHPPLNDPNAKYILDPARPLPFVFRRLPLWCALLWALCMFPAKTPRHGR